MGSVETERITIWVIINRVGPETEAELSIVVSTRNRSEPWHTFPVDPFYSLLYVLLGNVVARRMTYPLPRVLILFNQITV